MALYEHVVLLRPELSASQAEQTVAGCKDIIEKQGGKVGKIENWGLRTLAYKIKKNRKAHYSLMNIDAPHETIREMERQMRINDDVLRFMTIRVEAHSNEPSVMMQKRDRDDRRGGRRDRPSFGAGGGHDREARGRDRDLERDGRGPGAGAPRAQAASASRGARTEERGE